MSVLNFVKEAIRLSMHPVTLWILTPQYNRDRGQKYCDPVTLNANFLLNLVTNLIAKVGIEFILFCFEK